MLFACCLAAQNFVSSATASVPVMESKGQQCGRNSTGFLGINRIDCGGNCNLELDGKTQKSAWSFSTEPRIAEIAPTSPAARILRVGDAIVAINGFLITTIKGGALFANIEPDRNVTIRYRRGVQINDVVLRAESTCAPSANGLRTLKYAPVTENATAPSEPADGNLGISFACGPCWDKETDGHHEWSFSAPVTITRVWPGGAADRAGLRVGDQITAVNGNPIESRQGAELFGNPKAGQKMAITVVRPDGSWQIANVIPSGAGRQKSEN